MSLVTFIRRLFRHNPSRLAAERAVVIAVYEDAKRATVRGAGR